MPRRLFFFARRKARLLLVFSSLELFSLLFAETFAGGELIAHMRLVEEVAKWLAQHFVTLAAAIGAGASG